MRILMDSLGLDNYAIFVLLTGLMGWFLLADIGVGVSVQNHISESRAKNEPYDDLIYVSGLLAILLLIVTCVALYFISPLIAPWLLRNFGSVSDIAKTKLFFLVGVMSIGVSLGGIVYKVWYAEQRGYLSNILPALASVIGLIGVLFVKQMPLHDRLYFSLLAYVSPTALLPIVAILVRQKKYISKPLDEDFLKIFRKVIKRALRFWIFAIMAAAVLQVDYIIISQYLKSSDIAAYYLATKVFGLTMFIYNAVLSALWPNFTEYISKWKWEMVRNYIKKYLLIGFAFIFFSTLSLIWIMDIIVKFIAPNDDINIPPSLIILLGLYQMIRVWTDTFTMMLQSVSIIRPFLIFVPIQAFTNALFQVILAPAYGLHGVIIGLIISYIVTVTWALPSAVRAHYSKNVI